MTSKILNNIIISKYDSLKKALEIFDKSGDKCLVVVDKNQKFAGTLSNGDIRRSILKKIGLSAKIEKIYNKKSIFFYDNKYTNENLIKIFTKRKIDIIPIINNKRKIVDIKKYYEFISDEKIKINVPVVIMAGGQGTRMKPFTNILPKPLIPINNKTVIEHIMDNFLKYNINNFYFSLNYKSKILKTYLSELKSIFKIKFLTEKKELGTIGALRLLRNKIKKPFFVINCDTILNIDYLEFYNFHKKNKFDITIVASSKEFQIAYGSIELMKNGTLKEIKEKPKYDFLVNTGFYIIDPKLINLIPQNKKFDFNEFIYLIKNNKYKIGVFPVSDENWMDVGGWSEYQNTLSKL